MPPLHEIPGIEKGWLELLDGAGIRDAVHLALQDPHELLTKLDRANSALGISSHLPQLATVESWIAGAHQLLRNLPPEAFMELEVEDVCNEKDKIAAALKSAPFAIPIPGKVLRERQLNVSQVPIGLPVTP